MIQKNNVQFGDHLEYNKSNLVVSVNSIVEIESMIQFYLNSFSKIRGISLDFSLLNTLDSTIFKNSTINYFSVNLNLKSDDALVNTGLNIKKNLSKLKGTNVFLEVIIPVGVYSNEMLKYFSTVCRVIIDFRGLENILSLSEISADLISNKFFPFTVGIPFCHAKIDQMSELFGKLKGNKNADCNGCVYQKYCIGPGNFDVKKVNVVDEEIIKFLEENEGTINRL